MVPSSEEEMSVFPSRENWQCSTVLVWPGRLAKRAPDGSSTTWGGGGGENFGGETHGPGALMRGGKLPGLSVPRQGEGAFSTPPKKLEDCCFRVCCNMMFYMCQPTTFSISRWLACFGETNVMSKKMSDLRERER